jgi:hypothetical protein
MYIRAEKPKGNNGRSVANLAVQKKGAGKQTFGFLDRRPETNLLRNLQLMIANPPDKKPIGDQKKSVVQGGLGISSGATMQRLVVFSGANPPKDANIVATLPDTERSVGSPVVHENSNPDYGPARKIAMLSHGEKGTIDWKGAGWSGQKLVDDELLAKGRSISSGTLLELWSCSAGERSTETTNDSLVDHVTARLKAKKVTNIIVKGVKGSHIVLNDKGDHYIPDSSVPEDIFVNTFLELRAYYLWLFDFFTSTLTRKSLGGLEQKRVGLPSGWHPVLIPKKMEKANELIGDLKMLYEAEVSCGGINKSKINYESFLKRQIVVWQKMSSYLRTNDAFRAVTKKTNADWLELKT